MAIPIRASGGKAGRAVAKGGGASPTLAPGRGTPERMILAETARKNYREGVEKGAQKDPRNNKGVNRESIPSFKQTAKKAAAGGKSIDERQVDVSNSAHARGRLRGERIAEAAAKIGLFPSQYGPGFYDRTTRAKASLKEVIGMLGKTRG